MPAFRGTSETTERSPSSISRRAPTPRLPASSRLVHRAIPYPVVLVTELLEGEGEGTSRSSTSELARRHRPHRPRRRDHLDPSDFWREPGPRQAFLDALPLARQPQSSLHGTYQSWIDTVFALEAAQHTGALRQSKSPEHAAARQRALARLAEIDAEIATFRRAATREKQLARRADLNLRLAALRAERQAALDVL